MATIKIQITGMTCVNCANAIEKNVLKIQGVTSSKVSFADCSGVFEVQNDDDISKIKDKIKKLGFGVVNNYDELEAAQNKNAINLKNRLIISAILSVIIMVFEMNSYETLYKSLALFILTSIVIFYCGFDFFKHAMKSIKNSNYDMNVLITLGVSAAYIYSIFAFCFSNLMPEAMKYLYFSSCSMIITFVLLGKFLEERSKKSARNYIKALMDLSPKSALVLQKDGTTAPILVNDLKLGDIVVVKSGYALPCDGVIISGGAEIDASMLSGESMPVFKSVGDSVNAGTLNTNGYINIKVTKLSGDSLISVILELLLEASTKKMPIARLADKVANIFVPLVVFIALGTFALWSLCGEPFNGILAAVSVLIISCPCALGLATPIAIVVGISQSAKNGIIIKNPQILEILGDAKYAVFDKTGTLTKGQISVVSSNLDDESLKIVANAANLSEHPVSKAISEFAKEYIDKNVIYAYENIPGMGISAEHSEILIGNEKLLNSFNVFLDSEQKESIQKVLDSGLGVVLVALGFKYTGFIAISDTLKDDALQAISAVKSFGVTPIMLTGDNEKIAKIVAKELGIDEVIAGVLPSKKFEVIENLKKEGIVIFVGDGINDALALKSADIGIAMSSGSDIAKDAGDIVLIKNDLSSVAYSLYLAKRNMKTIKQNLVWAFVYNIVCIPVAAGVLYPVFGLLLNPMYAALAMSISSFSVVLNSLRLKFVKNVFEH
ncbi:copper-translocating P-type ATPase [Campylobacter hyointestinalis]|uniref:heavy metal translocating P-type ATPase n=1 Tax=Campylobacter hyointestinalis TaxID=198 RepID=UPI00072521D2|nr:copper-translocating P-type ATPase [Campylobacter hyointestinalis]